MSRTITGTILKFDGSPWAGARLVFWLLSDTATDTGIALPKWAETYHAEDDGAIPDGVTLETPTTGSFLYQLRIEENTPVSFYLEEGDGSDLTIDEIFALAGVENDTGTPQGLFLVDLYAAAAGATAGEVAESDGAGGVVFDEKFGVTTEAAAWVAAGSAGGALGELAYIDDADSDGTQYARKNGAWEEVDIAALAVLEAAMIPVAVADLAAVENGSTAIDLSWAYTEIGYIESFKLYRKEGVGGTYALIDSPASGDTSYNDTGLDGNTTYYYRLDAYNPYFTTAGNEASATTEDLYASLRIGLYAYWNMNESGNVTRADSVGSSDLLVTGTVNSTTGIIGNAGNYTGSIANYLGVADNPDISPAGTSFTIAFWVNLNSGVVQGFVSKFGGAGGNEFIVDLSTAVARLLVYGFTSGSSVSTTSVMSSTGVWYAIRAGWNSATNKLFIQVNDNALVEASTTGAINVSNSPLKFGVFDGGSRPANCKIDNAAFWKRTLTTDEWALWYNAGAGIEL